MKVNISAHQRSGKVNDVSQFRKTSFTMEISSPWLHKTSFIFIQSASKWLIYDGEILW